MKNKKKLIGLLPEVLKNPYGYYEGNLVHYFKLLVEKGNNLTRPYHNFRHMIHVLCLCYDACKFYGHSVGRKIITTPFELRMRRNLLIASLFHDWDHSGLSGDDDLNIARSVRVMQRSLLPEDVDHVYAIGTIMKATEMPHKDLVRDISAIGPLNLPCRIIRDADLSQALDVSWIQQVVFGLASEWGKKPIEILEMQKPFLSNLEYQTDWAKNKFTSADIQSKIKEAESLIQILKS